MRCSSGLRPALSTRSRSVRGSFTTSPQNRRVRSNGSDGQLARGRGALRVLILGGGGREHAIAWKLSRSPSVEALYCAPGNPGTSRVAENVALDPCDPASAAARIETSKAWAKQLMRRAGVPTADFEIFDDFHSASRHLASCDYPVGVKTDGPAQGKGVVVAADRGEAESAPAALMLDRRFGDAGRVVVIEECLAGWEVSAFAGTDGG